MFAARLRCTGLCLLLFATAHSPQIAAAVVLQYHHVSDHTPASTSTSPARFRRHLEYLAEQGFEVLPLQVMVDDLVKGREPSERTVAITFDDGYRSIYEVAYPLLKARGWPFTVFINTEPHDQRRALYMSWDQLREMTAHGATIANHAVSHASLIERRPEQDEAAWKTWVEDEIVQAERRIETEIGSRVKLLAYPYGEFDLAVREIAGRLGYVAFGQNSGPLARHNDLQALPRFPFGGAFGDPEDFAVKANSLPMPLAREPRVVRWEAEDGSELPDMVLSGPAPRPVLAMKFAPGFDFARLNCFASRQGRIDVGSTPPWARAQAPIALDKGRSRYNCTAPSGQRGRHFWISQQWIVR